MAIADGQFFASTVSTEELAAKLWQHLKGTLEENLEVLVEKAVQKAMPHQFSTVAKEVESVKQRLETILYCNMPEGDLAEPVAADCDDLSTDLVPNKGLSKPHSGMEEVFTSGPGISEQAVAMSSLANSAEGFSFASPTQLDDEAKAVKECILPGFVGDIYPNLPVESKSLNPVPSTLETQNLLTGSSSSNSSLVDASASSVRRKSRSLPKRIKLYWAFFGIIAWRKSICGTMYRSILFMALLSATLLSTNNLVQQPWRFF